MPTDNELAPIIRDISCPANCTYHSRCICIYCSLYKLAGLSVNLKWLCRLLYRSLCITAVLYTEILIVAGSVFFSVLFWWWTRLIFDTVPALLRKCVVYIHVNLAESQQCC